MEDGKQIRLGTILADRLLPAFLANLLKADGTTQWTALQNAGGFRLSNVGAPVVDTDVARLADIYAIPWKDKVVAATTTNITLTGTQTVDTIALVVGDRCLVRAQSSGSANGIYIVASGAWARAGDADSSTELRGAVVTVEKGAVNADKRFAQTADDIVLGTTSLTWVDIGTGTPAAFATTSNKNMSASVTTADFQVACATTLSAKPAGSNQYVAVLVNGLGESVGDGVKTTSCYFSSDSGATAKTFATLAGGETLYWVQSVAGYNLATTDRFDFSYSV